MDYDVYSNWGNWVSAAGMTGGRISHFNITKQSKVQTSRACPLSHLAQRVCSYGKCRIQPKANLVSWQHSRRLFPSYLLV